MADIYSELQQDHAELLRMLHYVADGGDATRTFPEVYNRLFAHLGAEQDTFYEELLLAKPTREHALEGFAEHRIVATLLSELAPGDPFEERWAATFAVLRKVFARHVADEEGPLFDLARKTLSEERAASLGGRFSAERERHMRFALAGR